MAGARRHAQNRGRQYSEMERYAASHSERICRHFLNGYCRFGSNCKFRHDWPVIPSTQICRYFQKGTCWYGEHCKYLHVVQNEGAAAAVGRRSSVPSVSSSSVAHALTDRRGSEPALLQAEATSRQQCSRRDSVVNVPNPQQITENPAADIAEEQSPETDPSVAASREAVGRSELAQGGASDGRKAQKTSSIDSVDSSAGAAAPAAAPAAASSSWKLEETEAFLQSKDVTCGICMDKVFEKPDRREHIFGILPNCNHSFCLQCIITWRKTKDFEQDVVKSCPQCRVKSTFYVPNKYWVEGQEKEKVIAAFRERCIKRRCSYYMRYGCCPFKTECLYRHDKTSRRRLFAYPEDVDDCDGVDLLNFFIALFGDNDDDDFDFPVYQGDDF